MGSLNEVRFNAINITRETVMTTGGTGAPPGPRQIAGSRERGEKRKKLKKLVNGLDVI